MPANEKTFGMRCLPLTAALLVGLSGMVSAQTVTPPQPPIGAPADPAASPLPPPFVSDGPVPGAAVAAAQGDPSPQATTTGDCVDVASVAEPATTPQPGAQDGTAPGNSGSSGFTGGLGGSQIGTNPQGAVVVSKTWQPPTVRGLDLKGAPDPVPAVATQAAPAAQPAVATTAAPDC